MKRALVLAIVLVATPAWAVEYVGYGDTGWSWYDKRDCCDEAVALAQDDSIRQCDAAGGAPKVRSGSQRGLCDWDARGDLEDRVYRCQARTSIHCR